MVTTWLDRVSISLAGPRMQEALNFAPAEWGWVMGMFTVAYPAFRIPRGTLGDRIGPRRVPSPDASLAVARWFPVAERGRTFGTFLMASQLG